MRFFLFTSKHPAHPINKSIYYAGPQTEDQHRPCDGEELDTGTGDDSLAFELNGRGGDGVGKAGDGHQSTRPRYLGDVVIQAEACEQNGQHHQRHGGRHGAVLFREAQSLVAVDKALTQDADQSPDPEGVEAIPKNGRFGAL